MTRVNNPRWRRLIAKAAAVLMVAAGTVVVQAAVATPAQAAGISRAYGYLVSKGPNMTVDNSEWLGSYRNGGRLGYCMDYNLRLTTSQDWKTLATTSTTWRRASYAINTWGNSTNRAVAAAVKIYLNDLVGNARWRADRAFYVNKINKIDKNVMAAYATIQQASTLYHGPHTAAVAITKQAQVGQVGQALIKVSSATGRGFPGANLSVSFAGAIAYGASPTKTNSSGLAVVNFRRTGVGAVTIGASVLSLPNSSAIMLGLPKGGQQRLLAPITTTRYNLFAKSAYNLGTSKVKYSYNCTSECNGAPPLTFGATNPVGAAGLRVMAFENGVLIKYLDIPNGKTLSTTVTVHHGKTITFGYRYLVGTTWSATVMWSGSTVVDCPPQPPLHFSGECLCVSSKIKLWTDTNNSGRNWSIIVNGNRTVIAPGAAGSVDLTLPKGTTSIGVGVQQGTGWRDKTQLTLTL